MPRWPPGASQALALRSTQEQLLNNQSAVRPNHRAITDLCLRIWQATTDAERAALYQEIAAGAGVNYSSEWAVRLIGDVDRAEANADVFNDSHVSGWINDLQRRIDKRFVDPVMGEIYDDTRGLEAGLLFRDELSEWMAEESQDGTKPSPREVRAKADELGAAILRNERFTFDQANAPRGGILRTPKELDTLGTRPAINSIQSLVEAPRGSVSFSTETLPQQDVVALLNDHLTRGESSTLSRLNVSK